MDRSRHPLKGLQTVSFSGLSPWQGYAVAIAATCGTLIARISLDDALGGEPTLIVLAIPIMFSAYLGGLRAGLLATGLSFLGACFFLLPPIHSFAVNSAIERWQLFFVVLAGVLISVLNGALHRAHRDTEQALEELAQHRRDLEQIVFSRTAQLAEARDAAEAASRAKSHFLANMSHELRTPMNGIMGMTELALTRAKDPQQIGWLTMGAESARHLLSILNDLLDFSRIEAGRLALQNSPFSPCLTIEESVLLLSAQAQAKGLTLSCNPDPAIPDRLMGDASRIRQVLLNFIGNAIKFSEHGHVLVTAKLLSGDLHSVWIRLDVADEGIGISEAQQAMLFRAFSQVDESSTRRYGGSGLGLAICRRLAHLMEGDVGVDSALGLGSTFWMTAHLARCASNELAAPEGIVGLRERLARNCRGQRVLVAEDDATAQSVARGLLEAAGMEVDVASNGREAIDMARAGCYALVLMDIRMPIMDGLDATRSIRELPGLANLPIIALTANAYPDDHERCIAAGMNWHLPKPVEPSVLYQMALEWMSPNKLRDR